MSTDAASPPAAIAAVQTEIKPNMLRQPSICMKPAQTPPAASPPAISIPAPLSLTSKEWVVPPRPKPGRKPATDTPPTKRKAQNRAAQRAFRERRAARVGELEEQMKQIEDEHEQEEDALRATIERLETELQHYRTDMAQWVDRCRRLEEELAALKPSNSTSHDVEVVATNDTSIGCGNCTLESRCQCIDDALAAMDGDPAQDDQHNHHEKRPHSPSHASTKKRIKLEPKESLETDFTTVCASKSADALRVDNHSPTPAVADPCGFCSDGTPCICAEVAAEQEQVQSNAVSIISRPTPAQLDQFTPPPMEGDVSLPIPTTAITTTSRCGASGPGTCGSVPR